MTNSHQLQEGFWCWHLPAGNEAPSPPSASQLLTVLLVSLSWCCLAQMCWEEGGGSSGSCGAFRPDVEGTLCDGEPCGSC